MFFLNLYDKKNTYSINHSSLTKKLKEKERQFQELKAKSKETSESNDLEEAQKPKGLPDRDLKRNLGCG